MAETTKTDKLIKFIDTEIEDLQSEIKRLEFEISSQSDEIAEVEKLIHDFSLAHNRELGKIVLRILQLRKEKLQHEKGQSEAKKKEFEEAERDYENFNRKFEEIKSEEQFNLTEEEKKVLKINYRKATKLCHPDVVTDELKEHAEIIFRELQSAYEQNNLKKVNEILEMLEKGEIFIPKSEGITEKIKLKSELAILKKKLNDLEFKLTELKKSDTYQTIINIDDWEKYFAVTKQKLIDELAILEN